MAVKLRHVDGVGDIVRARDGDDRDAVGLALDGIAQHLQMLLARERGFLAGRAHDDERVDALVDLPVDEAAHRLKIYALLGQGRDQRGGRAAEDRVLGHIGLSSLRRRAVSAARGAGLPEKYR